jgi:signal transduction histidine kinase
MTEFQSSTGYIDESGRLISADAAFAALHEDAGGTEGGVLAVPQLANLARIARSLAIPVSRPVILVDGTDTIEILARAKLEKGFVMITISDLGAGQKITLPTDLDDPARSADFERLEGEARFETDATLAITSVSAGLASLVGPPLADPIGKSLGSVFTPIAGPAGDMPLLAALVQRLAFAGQIALVAGDRDRRVILSGVPLGEENGAFSGYHGRIRVADHGLEDAQERGAALSAVAGRLDGALRGPIGRIVANADAINSARDGEIKDQYQDYAADISVAGRHLLGLVDDLVDLQAIERPDFQVEHEVLDLADIVRRAAGLLSVRAADHKVRIDQPDADEEIPARGEFRRVLQILVNLIGNAVRYSPPDSMVWIRTEVDGDLAVVVVADQGKGIAVEDQDRIFEKFERVDQAEPGGSGLGLYIARKLARAMGGDITVDSAPGLGARFALTLPSGL